MVWLTEPASNRRTVPWVRLARPEVTAASWSTIARSSRSDAASGSPSAVTTTAWATPGVLEAKLLMSQSRRSASVLVLTMGGILSQPRDDPL